MGSVSWPLELRVDARWSRWGGRFISSDVVSVHTYSCFTSFWVAHDRTTEHNHKEQTRRLLYILRQRQHPGSDLDGAVLNPSPCEYHIYTDVNSLAYETVEKCNQISPSLRRI